LGTRSFPVSYSLTKICPLSCLWKGDVECIKVIQVENASLANLTDVFHWVTVGCVVPAGTIISICSASYLAAVGVAVYAE
jgi:hypothetical protein